MSSTSCADLREASSGGSPGRDTQGVDDLIAFVRQRMLEDLERGVKYRIASRREDWSGRDPALLADDLDTQNNRLDSAIHVYRTGGVRGADERLRRLAFEAYGTRDDYREEWRPAVREEAVSPPEGGGNVNTPRDAFAELDELRRRVDRLERLLAVHVPA